MPCCSISLTNVYATLYCSDVNVATSRSSLHTAFIAAYSCTCWFRLSMYALSCTIHRSAEERHSDDG